MKEIIILGGPNGAGKTSAAKCFVVETTCAGQSNLNFIRRRRANGWRIVLLFLWLRSPQAAIQRVARRVRQGGHFVPPAVVTRRYWSGLSNMRNEYLPLADLAAIHDNSDRAQVLVAEKLEKNRLIVHDERRWRELSESPK